MIRYDSYIICTSPRSGSTLLCKMLSETGVAGAPESYFYHRDLDAWCRALGVDRDTPALLPRLFDVARDRGQAGGSLFALRQQRPGFPFLCDMLRALHPNLDSDVARIECVFGRTLFVHLTREDKVAQAVSLLRAEQTGLWHAWADGSDMDRKAATRRAGYDADALAEIVVRLTSYDADWSAWFDTEGVVPLRLTYEALSAAPTRVLARVLHALGLDPARAQDVAPPVRKLADATNATWIDRFRRAQD